MDAKLLKEFEEMEGLSKETLIDPDMAPVEEGNIEDEGSFKPTAASALNSSDIYYEVRYHCRPTVLLLYVSVTYVFKMLSLYYRWRKGT